VTRHLNRRERLDFAKIPVHFPVSREFGAETGPIRTAASAIVRDTAVRHSISLRVELDPTLPRTRGDRVQLQQVLMNLALNAIDAMKSSGGELRVASEGIEDNCLKISVTDSGIGLPTEGQDRIFEAFFTTKPQGTGMGLSISRRIIEAHGGTLLASPNPDRGATFCFTLPIA
jgi:signal transduction histidine kinase